MYDYLDNEMQQTRTIGSFTPMKNTEFKEGVKALVESFRGSYSLDAIDDIAKIVKSDVFREDYKENLIGDIANESFNDPYYDMLPQKMEQLFENTSMELARESSIGALAPIVGISLPILKKNFVECHAKDIMMTEVPTKPIIKAAFERKFLKDKTGGKHYIPDIFYDNSYKEILAATKGKAVSAAWYPEAGALPMQDLNILALSGGSLQTRDSLAYDFCVDAVQMEVPNAAGDGVVVKEIAGLNIQADMGSKNQFTYRVKATGDNGVVVEDTILGSVDPYQGTVSVATTAGKIKKVKFGGHLSNENNVETAELDREREVMTWHIPDGQRINTGLSIEKIKDYKALFNLDVTSELIADMSTTLTNFEDGEAMSFLDDSLAKWTNRKDLPFGYKDGFVENAEFDCQPPSAGLITTSQWINTELKFNLNQFINELKVKLRTSDVMFVVYGHPNNISLIQEDVRWVIDEDTKIGGVQLDYKFGVMTANQNRIHVVSSLKVNKDKGIRVVAYPLSDEVITFKHYKYSLNIENVYRNPYTPLIPNVMATSRYLTTEVLPVQGEFALKNNSWKK